MGVKILSLFDGMACGMIAMQLAGVDVGSYDAYEIDKYAIKTAQHNFPMIKEHGDVFAADFTQYKGVDFLIGGSPCTYWSIAQTKNRETVASGMGWELFSQYVRALKEAKPKYFIYENNKSMSKQIRASIDDAFGFEAICINSALVSAQNRQRLYWVGKRNADGTYSKVNVEQPADRGILLKDVLDSAVARDLTCNDKSYTLTASYDGACAWNTIERHPRNMVAEPISYCTDKNIEHLMRNFGSKGKIVDEESKTPTLMAAAGMGGGNHIYYADTIAEPINITADGKSQTLKAQYTKNNVDNFCCYSSTYGASGVAEPINVTADGKARTIIIKHGYNELNELHTRPDGKTNTLTTVLKDNQIMEPIHTMPVKEATAKGYTEIECGDCVDLSMPNSKTRRGRNMADKANCMQTSNDFYQYVGYVIEFDDDGRPTKAIGKDGKEITIKGKQYPIKLKDGYYIIRKLTVSECKRLQTVPEWYEFPVSNSQAYKMLGNGWTCEVIAHIVGSCLLSVNTIGGN